MKRKFRIFVSIILLILITMEGLLAQESSPTPPEDESRGVLRNRRMPPRSMHPQSFFVKKFQYTIDGTTVVINIHFNGSVDPKTIERRSLIERRRENVESVTYTYNRTADRVQITIELKNPPENNQLDFSMEGVESFGKGPVRNHFFENMEPSKIYEFEEDGTWKEY